MPLADYDWNAPRFRLELADGTYLTEARTRFLSSVTCKATVDGADELVIEATGWDSDNQVYRFLGENVLQAGNRVVLWGGYRDDLEALQAFTITRVRGNYTGDGVGVTIVGYSAEADLVANQTHRAFAGPISDSEIVTTIADDHGILAFVGRTLEETPERARGRVKESGTTDFEFLRKLAVANGFGPPVIRWDPDELGNVLTWRTSKLSNQDEIATFRFNPHAAGRRDAPVGTLFEFSPELSLAGVPTKLVVLGWHEEAQEPIKVVLEMTRSGQETTIYVGEDEAGPIKAPGWIKSGEQLAVTVLQEGKGKGRDSKDEVVATRTPKTPEDAVAWAERWFATRRRAFMTGRASLLAYPKLWPGQFHRFEGLAPEHNGLWEFLEVVHRFDASGYQAEASVAYVLEDAAEPDETTG